MTAGPQGDALTDRIYGVLFGRSSWLDFLEHARGIVPNGQALLFFHDAVAGAGAFPLHAGSDPDMVTAYREHYSQINPWMPHATTRPLGQVKQSDEMLPRDELMRTEFYDGFLKPQGIQTGFGVTIRRDQGCNFLFSVASADLDDDEAASAKATLQTLVPHLRNAFDYYRRYPLDAWFGPAWGGQARLPGARGLVRVGAGRRVLSADPTAVALADRADCLSLGAFERFVCDSEALSDYLDAQLATWDGGVSPPAVRTFHVMRWDGALPLRVTVYRPGGSSFTLFRGLECIVHIEDPADGLGPAVEEFAGLCGLSPAEERVVHGLAHGLTLKQVAKQIGNSVETARIQLKAIFAKTGLNRQSELVRHVAVMAAGRAHR